MTNPRQTNTSHCPTKKTISKSDQHLIKGVSNGKIDVVKELTPNSRTF